MGGAGQALPIFGSQESLKRLHPSRAFHPRTSEPARQDPDRGRARNGKSLQPSAPSSWSASSDCVCSTDVAAATELYVTHRTPRRVGSRSAETSHLAAGRLSVRDGHRPTAIDSTLLRLPTYFCTSPINALSVDRFGGIIIAARLETGVAVVLHRVRGQGDDRPRRTLPPAGVAWPRSHP